MKNRQFLSFLWLVLLTLSQVVFSQDTSKDKVEEEVTPYLEREELFAYVDEIVEKHNFDRQWVLDILATGEHQAFIIRLMNRTAEGTWTWTRYKKNFLDEDRISRGVSFWNKHQDTLQAAYEKYGVDPAIITAVIGVETRYGRVMGSTKILDALMTLGFDYPRRASYFRKELTHYLLMTSEEGLDATQLKGSYAGAMGYGQFMPSSYREYAVDFDGDGVRDLLGNQVDAIGSVAAYLSRHGWRRDAVVAVPAEIIGPLADDVKINKRRPHTLVQDYYPIAIPKQSFDGRHIDGNDKVTLLSLDIAQPEGEPEPEEFEKEYWFGLKNFYVITRYNTSRMYALAVYHLSNEISKRRALEQSNGNQE